ncbi:MAG: kynurenine 3-monooxygenase [Flavobacterium sp.]|uniref:FAD-dependent oxidoreductase n=1 Tax=Flavobacterium sp. TaxID=239 RepID=UPI000C67F893|nr:NAD(P)/FAD-dependent oxidoreductase [Flavobacterium sp.]MBF03316.1 kynurenine 3-monooxygenase [Flavobacterium sp.]|tara:strand:+ start:3835 stop:5181 length:1347 start_codon:yes stop_codon:yes gene_type:complete
MQNPKEIAVVGAGLVGSLLAIYLKRAGHTVDVYDRSPDIRKINFTGRSINLVLSDRGLRALKEVNLDQEIIKIGIPVDKRCIHTGQDTLTYQSYGKDGEVIYSLSRGLLNKKMVDLAVAEGINFNFESKIWDVTLSTATLHTGQEERGEWTEIKHDLVFGADGAFSRIRHRMQRQSMFNYSQEFLQLGYKELHIPANPDGTHKLDKHSLHIWPRGQFMLMALANLDGTFTCTLFMPHDGDNSFASLKNEQDLVRFFAEHFPDTKEVIPNLVEDFFKNPTSYLVTMKCYPWTYADKVALIGDACHAIVPFYGHGMNAGFEDITVLTEMMSKYGDDWANLLNDYENSRKPDTDAIAELSYRNFIEMSTKTADPNFILQKKIERWFSEKHPDKWVPLYSMVTFSHQPYSEALAIGDKQDAIMQEILAIDNIEQIWETEPIEQHILALLEQN